MKIKCNGVALTNVTDLKVERDPVEKDEQPKQNERRYRISYDLAHHPDGIPAADLDPDRGGADCVMLIGIVGRPGGPGPLDCCFLSKDGFTGGELTCHQQYQIWAMWAHGLKDLFPAGDPRRAIATAALEATRQMIGR